MSEEVFCIVMNQHAHVGRMGAMEVECEGSIHVTDAKMLYQGTTFV